MAEAPLHEDLAASYGGGDATTSPAAGTDLMSRGLGAQLPREQRTGDPPPPPLIDTAALGRLVSRFTGLDLSGIDRAVSAVSGGSTTLALPSPDSLMAPAQLFLASLRGADTGSAFALLHGLRASPPEAQVGLARVEAALGQVVGARRSAVVGSALSTVTGLIPTRLDVDGSIAKVRDGALAARDLVTMVGAMMSMHSAAEDLRDRARLQRGLLDADSVRALTSRARIWAESPALLAALAAITDPDDANQIAGAMTPFAGLLAALGELEEHVIRGMGFGEATLLHADPGAAVTTIEDAAALLRTVSPARIRTSAETAGAAIERGLPTLPGSPTADFDAAWSQATAVFGELGAAIDRIDAGPVTAPVSQAIGTVTNVVHEINRVFAAISGAIRGAFATIREVVAAIDLQAVADAIRSFLQPLVDAIGQLDALITAATTVIGDALAALEAAIGVVKDALITGTGYIKAGLRAVDQFITDLHLEDIVHGLEAGVQAVADELHKIQLQPYFDTANDVMNTGADVISVVPFGLLPDSAKQKLADVVEPIQRIDFRRDVSEVLQTELHAILDRLDTDVLGAVQDAYDRVVGFLESIDPHPLVAQLDGEFDAFLARVHAINPQELLRPATEAIDRIRTEIRAIDLQGRILAPIDGFVDRLMSGLDAVDPSALLEPLERQVDGVRRRIVELTRLDQWAGKVDEIYTTIDGFLGALDPAAQGARLDALVDAALAGARGQAGHSLIGSIVATLLDSAGLPARASSFLATARWIGGDDGAAEVRGLIAEGSLDLAASRATIAAIDLRAIAAELDGGIRRIRTALAAHRPDSALRVRFDAALAAVDPVAVLGALGANRDRYLAAIDAARGAVARLEGGGMSEITATAEGLRVALRPLASAKGRLLAVPRRFGIDLTGQDAAAMFATILAAIRPGRVLGSLAPIATALRDKLRAVLRDGLVTPVQAGITELTTLVNNLNIAVFREELSGLFTEVRQQINALRPSALLGPTFQALTALRDHLADYDPLLPVRHAIDTLAGAIDEVAAACRPSTLLADGLHAYDTIVNAARGLDVRHLLEPILSALADLEHQLGDGLDGSSDAFEHLQRALATIRGNAASATASASLSS